MIRTLSRTPRVGALHRRSFATSPAALATLGMRREDPRRVWERRAPLTPDAVRGLIKDNSVEVESCERRCFSDEQYEAVSSLTGLGLIVRLAPRSFQSSATQSTSCSASRSRGCRTSRS